jgi:ectoine hydroxylase-related dioxygenase (phytanoyl-CoA dioxygenase family)
MIVLNEIPQKSYGILKQNLSPTELEVISEEVRAVGYAILDSGYTQAQIQSFSQDFNVARVSYGECYTETYLKERNEHHTIRSPLTRWHSFLELALNDRLISLVGKCIPGKFILNQQNGVINPPRESYNQGSWHRDLPYQHYVSSKPLAVNAMFCVDEFTTDNGATFVLPASHKVEEFPSEAYIRRNARQVEAPSGSFIVMDCMLFHSGGFNKTGSARRGVNHVFNIPYFKQQINIPNSLRDVELSSHQKEILGFYYQEPGSIAEYLETRKLMTIAESEYA